MTNDIKDLSIEALKAIRDYAEASYMKSRIPENEKNYWLHVGYDCQRELELRISRIFPL